VSARLLDGASAAASIRAELQPRASAFAARAGRPAGLGVVLVGAHAPSEIYVRNKLKAASDIGCRAELFRLQESATLADVLDAVRQLNADDAFDGILVQDPLPPAMGSGASQAVFDVIDPAKDVDGFTPINAGLLSQGRAVLAPCTPSGVIALLTREGITMSGSHAVVIGRSDIVGKPMAMLLLHQHATVTICHSRTRDLAALTRQADILVAAVGRTAFVRPEHVRAGATVVDVGINRITDGGEVTALFPEGSTRHADFARRGSIVTGDVHPSVAEVAGALTPVPGGVGPLTIALLLQNTLTAAEARAGWSASR
jgi:methylenetetrahydrofolate dehydrogenase (NADP+) / methenyltetrahydrofolate cyclohydrolase